MALPGLFAVEVGYVSGNGEAVFDVEVDIDAMHAAALKNPKTADVIGSGRKGISLSNFMSGKERGYSKV